MKTYFLDIIPKIQRFSQKLDDLTILTNKHWVIFNESSSEKNVFIFREKNNQLLISNNGKIEKGTWEYLGNNSILIDRDSGTFLFKHGFIDDCVLALKVDGVEEYVLLLNEEWLENQIGSLESIFDFLNKKYIEQKLDNSFTLPNISLSKENDLDKKNNKNFSPNNFTTSWRDITIPAEIKSQMQMDTAFLTYSLKEIDYYIKFFKSKNYPFYAALALDAKKIKLDDELAQNLLMVANRDFNLNEINDVFKSLNTSL
ncbi:hypothetical protein NO995_05305 [Aestuariibaculum sp. M13]|uniref:hypothetical protein n=1 Tax=Aestuariibaculum sp. M13 TaxID=2967132 RepID=UPI002159E53B|nr:hypothetical protein [Aestuariibaculum sp. M13]MCR8667089.1 hypothetical protein [Aestuariibaculum sp. M13]